MKQLIFVVEDETEVRELARQCLERAGYVLRVRESQHRMFRTPGLDVHVHVWTAGSNDEQRHIAFRDRLRTNSDDRLLYEVTKRQLAARDWATSNDYAMAKTDVIALILQQAGQP